MSASKMAANLVARYLTSDGPERLAGLVVATGGRSKTGKTAADIHQLVVDYGDLATTEKWAEVLCLVMEVDMADAAEDWWGPISDWVPELDVRAEALRSNTGNLREVA